MTKKHTLLALVFLPLIIFVSLVASTTKASAASFNYTDHPMDDSTFRASFTMSTADIQNFLASKNSGLTNFSDVENCGSTSGSHYAFYATYYSCGSTVKASKIIYDASQAYGINPQAILATLQKEQSLITTPNPVSSQLNYAMGYGCPDSGGCSFAGFFNQVDNGTWQFRTDYELSSGNNYWGYSPSSYPCNGPTRYYNKALLPGNDVTFMDDSGTGYIHFGIPNASTATLYCYTPHVFPGSAQEYYSGSYWFVYYFSQWFGATVAPYSFKSPTDPTIYMYVNGYKLVVPAMGILQDYGVSPQSIQTLSQSTVDAIPTASGGLSPQISYLIKSPSDTDADGGTVYLVTIGQKYPITTLQQFNDFGFTAQQVAIVPSSFIDSINGSQPLSSFIKTPTSSVFQVANGQKRIIFDYATYRALNPSDAVTPVSYFVANLLPSGLPLANKEILVKYSDSNLVYLLLNGNYYSIPAFDTYNCWGFDTTLAVPVFQVADNSYLSTINPVSSLRCLYNDGAGTAYLLGKNAKYVVPPSFGISSQPFVPDLLTLAGKMPTAGAPLNSYIRGTVSSAVWFLQSGVRALVPSYSDYTLLNVGSSQLTVLDDSALSSIPASGVKLGPGQIVKADNSSAVYVISGSSRLLYARSDDFIGYKNSWSNIETIPAASLNQNYPYQSVSISAYLYDQPSNDVYLVDPNGCYLLDSTLLTAYGQSQASLASSQSYGSSTFNNLSFSSCRLGSQYVKDPAGSAVYLISGGNRYVFSGWTALVNYSHQANPYIINISTANLQTFPSGGPPI